MNIINGNGIPVENKTDLENICKYMSSVKFLLVRRKHSLGYIEFMRGRYAKDNIDGIIYLFQQMTPDEIKMIEMQSFDEMWVNFWPDINSTDPKKQFFTKKEYTESKEKYDALKYKIDVELGLDFYVKNVKPFYDTPEWSYPKGRKMRGESDLECAIREFCEETGYNAGKLVMLKNIQPFEEIFTGSNYKSYKHKYYLLYMDYENTIKNTEYDNTEVSKVEWKTFEECIQCIRPYNLEKKKLINNINSCIHKYSIYKVLC
jgi:ADP-ribose pyrophosphatase YjhB (NUDIX family)